jgi:hypothetical protein
MKKTIAICLVAILCGCDDPRNEKHASFPGLTKKFVVQMSNDKGWTVSDLECDSFSMQTQHNIVLWIDGTKSEIHADEIRVHTNTSGK